MAVDLTLRRPDGADLDISAPVGATVGAVLAGLSARLGPGDWWSGSRQLTGEDRLGGPGLRNGDIVSIGQAGPRAPAHNSVLQLQVIAGPGAGAITDLTIGLHVIGRGPGADIALPDPDVSRRHASLTVTSHGVTVHDLGSSNGTSVAEHDVPPDGAPLVAGQALRCGNCLLMLAPLPDPPAAGRIQHDARRAVNRPPRLPPRAAGRIELPAHPSPRVPLRVQWAAAIIGAGGGGVLALVLHSPLLLAFAALGPLTLLVTAALDRWSARTGRRTERRAFGRADRTAQAELGDALSAELAHLRRQHPDPAQIRVIVGSPTYRIWERRARDADALTVRVGVGQRRSGLELRRAGANVEPPDHRLAPVTVDLRMGPLGIVGRSGTALGLLRGIVASLCALHAPGDLAVIGLLAESRAERWRWLRWAPHLRTAADSDLTRAAAVADAVAELARRESTLRPGATWTGQWIVLLIDGAQAVSETPGLARLLRDGPRAGVTALCLDDEARLLPVSCATLVLVDARLGPWGRLVHDSTGSALDGGRRVLLDSLALAHCDELARALAQLCDPGDEAPTVPGQTRLLDLLGLPAPSAAQIRHGWAQSSGLRTAIGSGAHGPVDFDLDRDGPHALIAGTTGAGKSELLQGIVAGLAVSCPPQDLSFVLIDYKGGAAFGACATLPHITGLVTDLDSHLTERALRSLAAELRRREAALSRAGAKDIAAYRLAAAACPERHERVPHLVIVIDEFAALAQELPHFVSGLVAVAARGRSLGVHLVLATQRPSGVVSPEIRANTALRIALRVTDAGESIDVIGTAAAATISSTTPGRAYLSRSAGDGGPVLFQAARVSGSGSPPGATDVHVLDRWRTRARLEARAGAGIDDMAALVDAAARAAHTDQRAAAPWLPPLPALLPATDSRLIQRPDHPRSLPIGLRDSPDEQAQDVFALDLDQGGSLLIAGSARSGRTSALRTIAAAALRQTAGPVDLYVLDCAGGGLSGLGGAPDCAAALTVDDPDALAAAIRILGERIAAHRIGAARGPALLLIDGVEQLQAALDSVDPASGGEPLLALLRQAASGAITVVASGGRPALVGRVATAVSTKLLLAMSDRADYALAGIPAARIPHALGPGRALQSPDGREIQFGVLGTGDEADQERELARMIALAAPRPAAGPGRIRALPRVVRLADIPPADTSPAGAVGESAHCALLGLGGDDARPISAPLFAPGARVLIAGLPGSGRTTTLALIIAQARAAGRAVVVLRGHAPGMSPLPAHLRPDAVILVDDCEALNESPIGDRLAQLANDRSVSMPIIVAGNSQDPALGFRGVGAAVARRRTGILLIQGGGGTADVFGLALSRSRATGTPGRAILVGLGTDTTIQLALP
jgi:S-DNA-T family DNA segregation ATPase FtsK/SpoIIIE